MALILKKKMVQLAPMAVPTELAKRIDRMLERLQTARPWEARTKAGHIRELLHRGLDAMEAIVEAEEKQRQVPATGRSPSAKPMGKHARKVGQ